jgi:lipoate-protein ligase A
MNRYISNNNLDAAYALALDEAITHSVSKGEAAAILHLYCYKPAVLIGRYQNMRDSINIPACEQLGIQYNRRNTGGGTVMMGDGQQAMALAAANTLPFVAKTIKRNFEFLADIYCVMLKEYGIRAEFAGKNDLQVNGKKIAGLAISQDTEGATFFHASLLLDFDVPLMCRVLQLPTQKLTDGGISCFTERMTTVRTHCPEITLERVQADFKKALEAGMGLIFANDSLTPREEKQVDQLLVEKYRNEEWLFSTATTQRYNRQASLQTPGGVLHVYLQSTAVIEDVVICGNYFSHGRDMALLESSLKYVRADMDEVKKVIGEQYKNTIYRVTMDELLQVIEKALKDGTSKAKSRICAA